MKSLYIFADSERPDQYVNSIVHCVLDRDVRRIHIIHIQGFGSSHDPGAPVDGLSARLLGAVQVQLNGLAERGEYTFMDGKRKGERLLLSNEYGSERAKQIQELYRHCRAISLSYSNADIAYDQLRSRLRLIAKEGRSAYVDVTSIRKKYIGDVVAAGLVEGLQQLHTFDILLPKLDYDRPWTMLIHDLLGETSRLFSYTNILDTPVYRECSRVVFIRAPRLKLYAIATVILFVAAFIAYWLLGSTNQIVQTVLAMSGVASILSLVFVFITPRRSS